MAKVAAFFLLVVSIPILALATGYQKPVANASTTAQLPSIRACNASELTTLSSFLVEMVDWMDTLNTAANTGDTSEFLDAAVEMENYWYQESPDIPYCAQGVHTRLLLDRVVANFALAAYALAAFELDNVDVYMDRLNDSSDDLATYSRILEGYQ